MKKRDITSSFKSKAFRVGSYSAFAALFVIIVAVLINSIMGALPTTKTKLDLTSNQLYSISEQTESIVGALEQEVTIYHIVQSGYEDDTIEQMLQHYASLSDKITVVKKDPMLSPTFATQYTDEQLYNNSLIVVSDKRSRYVSYTDIYVTEYDYTSYYDYSSETYYYGESCLTSAIDYVTNDNLPKIYCLTGHGEVELSEYTETLSGAVEKENMTLETISLLTLESIPEDAAAIMILSPQSDISSDEKDMLSSWLANGGKLFLATDYLQTELTNLAALMADYGAASENGVVFEGDSNYSIRGYVHYLLPNINSHDITAPIANANYYILMPITHGIATLDDARDTITVTPLLTTSESAYLKTDVSNLTTMEKQDGDKEGAFDIAVAITDETESGTAQIVWFSTSSFIVDSINEAVSGANHDLFMNSLGWLCEREESISIHAKLVSDTYLTLTDSQRSSWSIILIAVIPIAFMSVGVIVFVRRRRK